MPIRMAALVLHAALCSGGLQAQDAEVDWRSRAQPGLDALVEFEADHAWGVRGGGGGGIVIRGEFRDRTFAREDDGALGVRTVRWRSSTRSHVRFFRVRADGLVEDEPPLRSFFFERSLPELPYSDPLNARVSELRVGLERERGIELRDPGFLERFRGAVAVREVVMDPPEGDPGRVVLRTLRDGGGPTSAETGNVLIELEDRCVFAPASGLLLERRVKHTTLDADRLERERTTTLTLVEVGASVSDRFLEDLEREGRLLFEAYCASRPAPEAALAQLEEWSALPQRRLGDVAAEIWLLAHDARSERDHFVRAARERVGAAWDGLAITAEDVRLAIEAGRVTALVARAVVPDGARHRDAWARSTRERRGEAHGAALLALHDVVSRATVDELREVELGPRRTAEVAALLEERLRLLR